MTRSLVSSRTVAFSVSDSHLCVLAEPPSRNVEEEVQHTLISPRRNRNFCLRIQGSSEEWTVRLCNGLLQPRPPLRRGVLVTLDSIQSAFRRVDDELWRIVAASTHNRISPSLEKSCTPCEVGLFVRTHKNPWPMLTMGWTGLAAAASLTILHTSCF